MRYRNKDGLSRKKKSQFEYERLMKNERKNFLEDEEKEERILKKIRIEI